VDVAFLDQKLGVQVSQNLKHKTKNKMVLVKSDIIMDSIGPYLKALQGMEPLTVPFDRYLQLQAQNRDVKIDVPAYSRLPGFQWDLRCLLRPEVENLPTTFFDPTDAHELQQARNLLENSSLLDRSQANAIMDILTQEVALIQG
jgi:hypothetical protein